MPLCTEQLAKAYFSLTFILVPGSPAALSAAEPDYYGGDGREDDHLQGFQGAL